LICDRRSLGGKPPLEETIRISAVPVDKIQFLTDQWLFSPVFVAAGAEDVLTFDNGNSFPPYVYKPYFQMAASRFVLIFLSFGYKNSSIFWWT
jgi:hypothetical protein